MKKRSEEELQRIIALCEEIEKKGADPFAVNVAHELEKLRKLLPLWRRFRELRLDAEALYRITRVIKRQEELVKFRSTNLYFDPEFMEFRLLSKSPRELADAYLRSWRPLISCQQVNLEMLRQGYMYWNSLRRISRDFTAGGKMEEMSLDKLKELRILGGDLEKRLNELLEELRDKSRGEWIEYWRFIDRGGFEERVRRAFYLSHLISMGYADMKIDPITEEIKIRYVSERLRGMGRSIPIVIGGEEDE